MATKQTKSKTVAPQAETLKTNNQQVEITKPVEAPKVVETPKPAEPEVEKKIEDPLQKRKAELKVKLYEDSHLKTDPGRTNHIISYINGINSRGHRTIWKKRLTTHYYAMPESLTTISEVDKKNPLIKKYVNICNFIASIEKKLKETKNPTLEENLARLEENKAGIEAMVANKKGSVCAGSAQFSCVDFDADGKEVKTLKIDRLHKADYHRCDTPFTAVSDYAVRKFVEEVINYKVANKATTKKIDVDDAIRVVQRLDENKHPLRNLYREYNAYFLENEKVDDHNIPISVNFQADNIVEKIDDKENCLLFDKISESGKYESKMRGVLMQTIEKSDKKKPIPTTTMTANDAITARIFPQLFTKKFLGKEKHSPISPGFSVYIAGMSAYIIAKLAESINTYYVAKKTLSASYEIIRACIEGFVIFYIHNTASPQYKSIMDHIDQVIDICEEIDDLTNAGKNKDGEKYKELCNEIANKIPHKHVKKEELTTDDGEQGENDQTETEETPVAEETN